MKSEFITTFITLNYISFTSLLYKLPFSVHSFGGTLDKPMETHNFYFKMHLSYALSLSLSLSSTIDLGNLITVPGSRPWNTFVSLTQYAAVQYSAHFFIY